MISSEPTLGLDNPSKKDVPEHLLSKIFPLLGFDYEPVSEPCISHKISKSKSPKGISIISKQSFNKKPTNLLKCNYIDKWNQAIGDKAKINQKLFKKIMASFDTMNPEEELINISDRIQFFMEQYRPDLYSHEFIKAAIKYMDTHHNIRFQEQYKLCNIILWICTHRNVLQFIVQDGKRQLIVIQQILYQISGAYLSPKDHPELNYSPHILRETIQHFITRIWNILRMIPKAYQTSILNYLIQQSFSTDSIATIIKLLLQSSSLNLPKILDSSNDTSIKSLVIEQSVLPIRIGIVAGQAPRIFRQSGMKLDSQRSTTSTSVSIE